MKKKKKKNLFITNTHILVEQKYALNNTTMIGKKFQ